MLGIVRVRSLSRFAIRAIVEFYRKSLDRVLIYDTLNIIMKTASVADLRNRFATVSRWIYEGESVTIKKRGKVFAILAPAEPRKKIAIALPDYESRLQRIFGERPHRGATAEEIVDEMRGKY